jgi:adenine-specific DNA-methyltransferase
LKSLIEDLILLATEPSYILDGKIAKDIVVESALNLDKTLLDLLASNENMSKQFFKKLNNYLVFDKVKFQKFILNKDFLPDSYTQFKINIGLSTEEHYINDDDRVVLNWPYKDCLLEGGQDSEDSKRNEIFWNEILAPVSDNKTFKAQSFECGSEI